MRPVGLDARPGLALGALVSVALHLGAGTLVLTRRLHEPAPPALATLDVSFSFAPDSAKRPIEERGAGGASTSDERASGRASSGASGALDTARDTREGSAPRVALRRRGDDPRERHARSALTMEEVAATLGGALAFDVSPTPEGALSALRAGDEERAQAYVDDLDGAPRAAAGLDMIGSGRAGGCAGEACAAGLVGEGRAGIGAHGARRAPPLLAAPGPAYGGRSLHICRPDACPRRVRAVFSTRVVSVRGPRDPEQSARVLRLHRPAMDACVADPRTRFTLTYDLAVDASGSVGGVSVVNEPTPNISPHTDAHALRTCLAAVLTRATFPSAPDMTWVRVEISRSARGMD